MNLVGRIETAGGADALRAPPRAEASWRPALIALAVALAAWALMFSEEIGAAVHVWNTSTAYNHCWLVGPIAAWLAWQRRARLAFLGPVPAPAFALLAIPGTLAWLAAERLGIMEGRQLVAYGLAMVLVLAVLGWRFCLAFAGPLAYLVFLVPFGGFAVGPLQYITARLIDWGLDPVGITHYVDGLMIETTAGLFHVAEACAGLRFIIAALAFGALYALVIFRSPWRRLIVMTLALVVPVLANGVRAWGIVVLAEYLGSAEAAAADHIIYGWGFFSAIILLLVLAGLPFREDGAPPPLPRHTVPPGRGRPRPAALAAALVPAVALPAAGPAVAAPLAYQRGGPEERVARLMPVEGCLATANGLDCPGLAVTARMRVFSPRANWREVSAARWRLGGSDDTDLTFTVPIGPAGGPAGGVWRARQPSEGGSASAIATWLDGKPVGDGVRTRLAQARNSLLRDGGRPVLVLVEARPREGTAPLPPARERALVQAGLAAQETGPAAAAAERSRQP